MMNQFVRYFPTLKYIRSPGIKKILEVGSGTQGLGPYLNTRFVGVDMTFTDYRNEKLALNANIVPVKADAMRLPFKEKSFDFTVCLDMIEHVDAAKREQVMDELMRITRSTIIVGFPCGEEALKCDRKLNDFYLGRGETPPAWLTEHLLNGFPSDDWLERYLRSRNAKHKITKNENLTLHYSLSVLEAIPVAGFFLGAIYNRIFMKIIKSRGLSWLLSPALSMIDKGLCYRLLAVITPGDAAS